MHRAAFVDIKEAITSNEYLIVEDAKWNEDRDKSSTNEKVWFTRSIPLLVYPSRIWMNDPSSELHASKSIRFAQ